MRCPQLRCLSLSVAAIVGCGSPTQPNDGGTGATDASLIRDAHRLTLDATAADGAPLDALAPDAAGDASVPDASAPVCGNEVEEGAETCDDGNRITGDGCSQDCELELEFNHADEIVGTPMAGPGIDEPANAINGIGGGFDVFSLGYDEANRSITLFWSGRRVLNGPGVDFVVFENGFAIAGRPDEYFMDHLIVEVSLDGETWASLPHDYRHDPETVYSARAEHWVGFAGVWPVLYRSDEGGNPFDFESAGGDAFDLDALPTDSEPAATIVRRGFRFIRLRTAPSVVNRDTDDTFVRDPISNGADVDGVIARYLVAEASD